MFVLIYSDRLHEKEKKTEKEMKKEEKNEKSMKSFIFKYKFYDLLRDFRNSKSSKNLVRSQKFITFACAL